jgi:hypothetical protein
MRMRGSDRCQVIRWQVGHQAGECSRCGRGAQDGFDMGVDHLIGKMPGLP